MIFGFCLGDYRTSAKIQIFIRKIGVLRSTLEAQAKIAPQQLMLGQRRFSGTPHLSIEGLASVFLTSNLNQKPASAATEAMASASF